MKKIGFIVLFLMGVLFSLSQEKNNNILREFNQPKLQWWQQARFGMFIHWGPVSLTGKELSWSRAGYGISKYDSLYLRFNPTKFNADKWVSTAKQAGMKYMVLTAKHHDGFCLWNTKTTNYNIMQTPFGRDVCKELANAAHKANMPICWYFSVADWKAADCRNPKTNHLFVDRVLAQLTELLTNYGKIPLLWIDYEGMPSPIQPKLVYELANKLQPGIIINNRLDVLHTDESHSYIGKWGDYATPEGFVAGYGAIPWETCTNLGHQWAWKFNDTPRSLKEAATTLLRCVGGNGNLLLNVGPDSLGQIPSDFESRLQEFGNWLTPIQKSIYATNGGPYAPTKNVVSSYANKSVFIHVLNTKTDTIILPPLSIKILDAKLMNGDSVSIIQNKNSVQLIFLKPHLDSISTTVELTLQKPAELVGIIKPLSTSSSLAYAKKATASSSVGQFLHDVSAAFDDNPNTYWLLGRNDSVNTDVYFGTSVHYIRNRDEMNKIFNTSGWLEVDLGKSQLVGSVKLLEHVLMKSQILDFEIQYRKERNWVTWVRDTQMGNWQKTLQPVKARYFRLVINKRDYVSGIREFKLFPPLISSNY